MARRKEGDRVLLLLLFVGVTLAIGGPAKPKKPKKPPETLGPKEGGSFGGGGASGTW